MTGLSSLRRRTSIESAGVLRPHDHVMWFGDGRDELSAVASTALADGARRHEKLMFVAEDPDLELLSGDGDFERLHAEGQLELWRVGEVYGTANTFSASAQLAMFEGLLADALATGYQGIRVVADNTPLVSGDDAGFHRWLEWEQLTDHFQAASKVTGVCFFDRTALSGERQADLAALHPVRSASTTEPRFTMCSDGEGVAVTGTLDASSVEQFRRLIENAPLHPPLVLDLSSADRVDHDALRVVVAAAGPERPLAVRGARQLRELVSLTGGATRHLRFERDPGVAPTCTGCGDWIGDYEPTVVVLDGTVCVTSRTAAPAVVDAAAERYHRACHEVR